MSTMTTEIKRDDYLQGPRDEILTHILGQVSSVEVLIDKRIRVRILQLESFNNPNLSLVNGRTIDCIFPEIGGGKSAPYQELINCISSSMPRHSGNTLDLLDLIGCSVLATVKPKYIKKSKIYSTKLKNLVILPSH